MTRLSALTTGHLNPPGDTLGIRICQRLIRPQSHSAAGMIMSMKNPDDLIGNRLAAQYLNKLRHRVPSKISKDVEILLLQFFWRT